MKIPEPMIEPTITVIPFSNVIFGFKPTTSLASPSVSVTPSPWDTVRYSFFSSDMLQGIEHVTSTQYSLVNTTGTHVIMKARSERGSTKPPKFLYIIIIIMHNTYYVILRYKFKFDYFD